uniref:Uncharacterized protein n=1 Tax=Oryza meridionalis TaxID=40149 RepID=A0A0E0FDP4_9ORYZ
MRRRSLPPVCEDLRRGWGKRPARREEDVAAGDEPRAVSSRYVEDLVCVALRQRYVAAEPPAGIHRRREEGRRWPEPGNGVMAWPEPWEGGVAVAGARGGRGSGGGSWSLEMGVAGRWLEPGEGRAVVVVSVGVRYVQLLIPSRNHLISGRYRLIPLIPLKYHLLRGKNRMIPDSNYGHLMHDAFRAEMFGQYVIGLCGPVHLGVESITDPFMV